MNTKQSQDIPNYVFLSYAGKDHEIAKSLCDNINSSLSSSYYCELVEDRAESDTTFTEKVVSYFRKCNTFIVLLTKASLFNQFVNQEWGYAKCLKEFGQIQLLIHITEISESNEKIGSSGFISNNMDFIDLRLIKNDEYDSSVMINNVVNFLRKKSNSLLPVYTEKEQKLLRFCKEIVWNVKLAEKLTGQEKSLREHLAFDVLPFRYDYALHVLQIGHLFPFPFQEQIERFVNELQTTNMYKEVILQWAVSRGQYHEGGVTDFFNLHLPRVRRLLSEMETSAYAEYDKIKPRKENAP